MTVLAFTPTATGGSLKSEIVAATECAEDLITLWREQRWLAHRVRLARLRFDLIGLDPDQQDEIEAEVAEWKRLVASYAESRGAA
jgi:hypothetical protein